MPCNCEHMEPTWAEIQSRKVCGHICYVLGAMGEDPPGWAVSGADSYYGARDRLTEAEDLLRATLAALSKSKFEAIVYNAMNKHSRALADWYEEDTERRKVEHAKRMEEKRMEKAAEDILGKLRDEEVEILRNYLKR